MRPQAAGENHRRIRVAGALIFVGAVWFTVSMVVSEALIPDYSISSETISALGSTLFSLSCLKLVCSMIHQPASIIFVSSEFIIAILLLLSTQLIRKASKHRRFALALGIVGVGKILVGFSYLPLYAGDSSATLVPIVFAIHASGALISFALTPLMAISSYRLTGAPLGYLSVILGLVSLVASLLFTSFNFLGLGPGGMERLAEYPLLLWLTGFGAYLMGVSNSSEF